MEPLSAKISTRPSIISFGNESLDKFLGGGLLHSSLNIFEHDGPSSKLLDSVCNKSLAARTLSLKNNLIVVDFNTSSDLCEESLLASLPVPRKIKSEVLYKDIKNRSAVSQIKIAWRYSNRGSSPSDSTLKVNQIDFGLCLKKETEPEELGKLKLIKIDANFSFREFLNALDKTKNDLSHDRKIVNIIIKDLLHPFSPLVDETGLLLKFLYMMRCFSRTLELGAILINYNLRLCRDHQKMKQYIYNLSDCTVSSQSYENGLDKLSEYKNIDGTLELVKIPKLNTLGFHYQPELSDWGYRFTKPHRYFVVDELNLPPCQDSDENQDSKVKKQSATDLMKLSQERKQLDQVGPLEDFKEVATRVLPERF